MASNPWESRLQRAEIALDSTSWPIESWRWAWAKLALHFGGLARLSKKTSLHCASRFGFYSIASTSVCKEIHTALHNPANYSMQSLLVLSKLEPSYICVGSRVLSCQH